jgi:hypothetical protein
MPQLSRRQKFNKGDPKYKRNSRGDIVPKVKSEQGKKNQWIKAVAQAKRELGVPKHEFVAVKKGSRLHKVAKEIHSRR